MEDVKVPDKERDMRDEDKITNVVRASDDPGQHKQRRTLRVDLVL